MRLTFRCILPSILLTTLWLAPSAEACVGPPPEPFCTKTLQLAIAGPPLVLLPDGGTFEVSALVYFGLLEFPPGFGICPDGPYTVDIDWDHMQFATGKVFVRLYKNGEWHRTIEGDIKEIIKNYTKH